MQTYGNDRHGATVDVVARVFDPLVIESDVNLPQNGEAVICLDDLLRSRMREPPIADEDPETARIQILFAFCRNPIIDGGDADSVFGTMPAKTLDRDTHCDGAIDVRELVDLDVARRLADTCEHAQIRGDGLLEIETCAQTAPVLTNVRGVRRRAGHCREFDRVIEETHPATAVKPGDEDTADLAKHFVPLLDLGIDLEFVKSGIQMWAVRDVREIRSEEHTSELQSLRHLV